MKSLQQSLAFILPCSLLLSASLVGWAYQDDTEPTPPTVQQAQETPEQLQQLVAPIALYPDNLVAQILAAATYPAQVVEADRFLQQHRGLKETALAQAVDPQPWDSSVKALTQFPKVLANMDKNLTWTSQLGDAYINQQQDVTDAVQALRQRARQAGHLQSNTQQNVTDQGQTIVIEPANPDVVYVPEYDPWAVYGAPFAPYPFWAPYPGLYIAGPGIEFGVGFGFGFFGGFGWGWNHWGVDWHAHHVMYNHAPFFSHSPTFFDHHNFGQGRPGEGGFQGRSAFGNSGAAFHRSATPTVGAGTRSNAFSSFNHGAVTRGNSFRGQSSFGGGSRGGSFGGGGFHGGGGGGSHGGGGGGHR